MRSERFMQRQVLVPCHAPGAAFQLKDRGDNFIVTLPCEPENANPSSFDARTDGSMSSLPFVVHTSPVGGGRRRAQAFFNS